MEITASKPLLVLNFDMYLNYFQRERRHWLWFDVEER